MQFGFWKSKARWPTPALEDLAKRSQVLVIDDEDFPYLSLFQRDGYNVTHWRDVDDLPKVERGFYDIILLDINGVGRSHSQDEGLGVLRHLKKTSPAQIIVAYSNNDWPLSTREFFDSADATLDKRQDYVAFKEVVDAQLKRRFSLEFYLEKISGVAGLSSEQRQKMRSLAERALLERDPGIIERSLQSSRVPRDTLLAVMQIIQAGAAVLQLLLPK